MERQLFGDTKHQLQAILQEHRLKRCESATVDCSNPTVAATLGSCASGSATSTFSMTNPQVTSTTVFFEVEYKVTDSSGNDGAWTAHSSGSSVSAPQVIS